MVVGFVAFVQSTANRVSKCRPAAHMLVQVIFRAS